ncbi:type II/IV secretion system protein [Prochlorococcus marinus XMU1419]|uniref:GspE/PulE family protein n=1 Tax=Prochlorococcus marinus TaxID=1219 RepID=UPI001ADD3693|nr:GspE/PulE family protein [Prochlorococcus marinus]MBO8233581.1 type II/IV secretion system protein [Prochlorococcus marinus XMU1419]MBW3077060.1 type II/IV secretion system protein [Prochlorococcus marinus str. XMU1419]
MSKAQYTASSVRKLVDKYFSLQWCRDNLVVPLYQETTLPMKPGIIKIAVANYSYLGTIAEPIKQRLAQSDQKCEFVEKTQEEIQEILDLASEERFISGDSIEISQFDEDAVLEAIKETSENDEDTFDFEFDDDNEELEKEEDSLDLAIEMMESKIQKAAGMVLINSKKNNVSDIHIEPKEDGYKIRVRKDGVMQKFMSMTRRPGMQLVTCLKNMALMDIAERRASQDGKILRKFEGNRLEFRCSTVPSKHGEKMVLRILNSDPSALNLDTLIHIESVRKNFRKIMNASNGIVIVSGPTGSGKSTTLAAALQEKDNGELNIVTAEDPIEYDLGGDINQVQVNNAKGQTFAMLLRTFLRQDPDVILIGETRDPETAESSMDAAETGHLVFTTLHANSSCSSLTRLLDMEVPKYKLNASVRGVLAQRLLRKVCTGCSIKRPISEKDATDFQIKRNTPIMYANSLSAEEKAARKRENTLCPQCQGSGYKGRIGAYELLLLDRKIQNAISNGMTNREVEEIAVNENSMLTLTQYGVELVKEHLTTISEVIRVCKSDH